MWRAIFGMTVVLAFAGWIGFQMFKIQVVEGEMWMAQSDSLTIVQQDISPARGNIYSDDGSLLATSMPIYQIRWDATVVNSDTFKAYVDDLAYELSRLYPEKTASYYRKMLRQARSDKNRYKLIRRRANYHEQKAMRAMPIFNQGRYKGGFIAQLSTRRVHTAGQLAFRTVGYRTEDNPGVGLERSFDEDLGGVTGKRLAQRISGGYRPINDENLVEPQNGRDVHTTINIDFQEIAQRALYDGLSLHKADHGSVIVMEVATGNIKAIANLKSDGKGGYSERYNYAVGEGYEPGSVWKVFSAMAAMEDGLVDLNDTVNLMKGYREYFGQPMIDSDRGMYEKASFKDAFARSSNVGFSSIIYDNYNQRPNDYIAHLRRLGLDKKTGVEIMGEGTPVLNHPSSSNWSRLTLPWLAIGYENKHTPLQVLTAYNAVINKGRLVHPRLVSRVTDAGLVIRDFEEDMDYEEVCSEETSRKVIELTKAVFEYGSGKRARSEAVSLGGKTGTAQIASSSGYQRMKQYNASFVGHFPADEPVYSVYVMVNRPSNGVFYASVVAAPIFSEIAEKIYTISVKKEVEPRDTLIYPPYLTGYYADLDVLNEGLGVYLKQEVTAEVISIQSDGRVQPRMTPVNAVPDVRNMGLKDAMYLLELHGYVPMVSGVGRVVKQTPAPNTRAEKGRKIYIGLK